MTGHVYLQITSLYIMNCVHQPPEDSSIADILIWDSLPPKELQTRNSGFQLFQFRVPVCEWAENRNGESAFLCYYKFFIRQTKCQLPYLGYHLVMMNSIIFHHFYHFGLFPSNRFCDVKRGQKIESFFKLLMKLLRVIKLVCVFCRYFPK